MKPEPVDMALVDLAELLWEQDWQDYLEEEWDRQRELIRPDNGETDQEHGR